MKHGNVVETVTVELMGALGTLTIVATIDAGGWLCVVNETVDLKETIFVFIDGLPLDGVGWLGLLHQRAEVVLVWLDRTRNVWVDFFDDPLRDLPCVLVLLLVVVVHKSVVSWLSLERQLWVLFFNRNEGQVRDVLKRVSKLPMSPLVGFALLR